MGWVGSLWNAAREVAVLAADTAINIPKTAVEVVVKVVERPADIFQNPRKVFADPILHNNPIARNLTEGVLQVFTDKDLHTLTYGPFGGRNDWMLNKKAYLDGKKINQIILPATHDSGTFDLSLRSSEDSPEIVAILAKVPFSSSQIRGWAQSQYLNFCGQLDLGIRWFDLRVGVSESENNPLRIFHSVESNDNLDSMLSPMGPWLRSNRGEIIILKVHRAMGFNNRIDKYKDLIRTFETIFGDMLAPWSYFLEGKQYKDYVSSNKRCIVVFCDEKAINPDAPNSPPSWVWKEKECMGAGEHQIKEYGDLVWSPTETPTTPAEYATFITSSLIEYGAKAHNAEAEGKLSRANLKGKGSVVSLDFPEIPGRGLLDYIVDLNA